MKNPKKYHVGKIEGFIIGVQCRIIDVLFDVRVWLRRFESVPTKRVLDGYRGWLSSVAVWLGNALHKVRF